MRLIQRNLELFREQKRVLFPPEGPGRTALKPRAGTGATLLAKFDETCSQMRLNLLAISVYDTFFVKFKPPQVNRGLRSNPKETYNFANLQTDQL